MAELNRFVNEKLIHNAAKRFFFLLLPREKFLNIA